MRRLLAIALLALPLAACTPAHTHLCSKDCGLVVPLTSCARGDEPEGC